MISEKLKSLGLTGFSKSKEETEEYIFGKKYRIDYTYKENCEVKTTVTIATTDKPQKNNLWTYINGKIFANPNKKVPEFPSDLEEIIQNLPENIQEAMGRKIKK